MNLSLIRARALSLFVLVLVCAGVSVAQITLRTETSSVGRLELVVYPFTANGDGAFIGELPTQLSELVKGDLAYSGFFNIVDPSDLPPDTTIQVKKVGGTYDTLKTFSGSTAARVRGTVSVQWDKSVASIAIFQPPLRDPIHIADFTFQADKARDAAHEIAAWITRMLTGEEGSFLSRIVFVVKTGQNKDLWLMDWDGANARSLTRDQTLNLSPTWAPDGKSIYFTSFRNGDADVYRYDLEAGKVKPFIQTRRTDSAPAVSLDGQWVAYGSSESGNFEVYRIRTDGSQKTQLTFNGRDDTSPSWSPTGRELVFTSDRSGQPQIYVMDFDGLSVRRLTGSGVYNETARWSPRGDLIAFCSRESNLYPKFQVFTVSPAGGRERRLTEGGNKFDCSWSPDGMKIVYTVSSEGRTSIWTMNWDGSSPRQLTFGLEASQPQWGPVVPFVSP